MRRIFHRISRKRVHRQSRKRPLCLNPYPRSRTCELGLSPRRGRLRVAQRFSAGSINKNENEARGAGDREFRVRKSRFEKLCRPLRGLGLKDWAPFPSDESLGYFRPSASRTWFISISIRTLVAIALALLTPPIVLGQAKPDKDYLVYVVSESA